MSDCCDAEIDKALTGQRCAACGQWPCVGYDYPEPARPTREDDDVLLGTSEAAERELDRIMAERYEQEEERPLATEPGPCERVGRYLDGVLSTVGEVIRLMTRRGC